MMVVAVSGKVSGHHGWRTRGSAIVRVRDEGYKPDMVGCLGSNPRAVFELDPLGYVKAPGIRVSLALG